MKRLQKILLFGIGCFLSFSLSAQTVKDLRLNEILVTNTDDYQDDFGQQNAWIEIFNIGYGTVDIAGCYLTNDVNNLKMYVIPSGDVLTKIKPRQHILFWADNQPSRGTFHINFTLAESKEILLVSNNGKTVLDRMTVPQNLLPNQSYGRIDDGVGTYGAKANSTASDSGWAVMDRTTPSSNNAAISEESKSSRMLRIDPHGGIMALTAMSVVFLALLLLFLAFRGIGKLSVSILQHKSDVKTGGSQDFEKISGETFAAIAAGLHFYLRDTEVHDIEHTILTIEKVKRSYSPWSSKFYNMRQTPIKR